MSDYKGIQGFTVPVLNQNPVTAFPGNTTNSGLIWYSTVNGNFYLQKPTAITANVYSYKITIT
jgi:hypothetical protein